MRRLLAILVLLCAVAAQAAEPQPGRDYRVLERPLASESKGRIEVVEFFWYGCPHCNDFESVLANWRKTLPADVSFRRVPAVLRPSWLPGAKLFYTLEAMGITERHHAAAFYAIHEARMRLDEDDTLFAWIASRGVDRRRFAEIYASEEVQAQVRRAREQAHLAGVSGVPMLVIGGRFAPLNAAVDSYDDLVRMADQLIQRARSDAAVKK